MVAIVVAVVHNPVAFAVATVVVVVVDDDEESLISKLSNKSGSPIENNP